MKQAVPSADVTGYRRHLSAITLPDPDDRHVVAAGIAGGASVIVTWNQKDFPAAELSRHGLTVQSPEAFACDLYAADPMLVLESVKRARANLRRSRPSAAQYVQILAARGWSGFPLCCRRISAGAERGHRPQGHCPRRAEDPAAQRVWLVRAGRLGVYGLTAAGAGGAGAVGE